MTESQKESKKKQTSMQENVTIEEVANKQSNMTEEATRMWLETVKAVSRIEKRHHEEMGNLRRQMTRNYNCLMKEIDKSKTDTKITVID